MKIAVVAGNGRAARKIISEAVSRGLEVTAFGRRDNNTDAQHYVKKDIFARNGIDRYDPARFLDYKLEVLQMLLYCLPRFDPEQETEFLKYAKHYVRDGLLFCRMMVEAGSFASLAEYRHVRQIGAIYNNSAKTAQKSFPSLPSKADTRMKAYLRMNC